MTRSIKHSTRSPAADASFLTWILVISGFIVFYFGSQVLTPEDAHLWHWGSAFAGGVLGWLVGTAIARLRRGSQ